MEIDVALCLPREAETVAIVRDVAMAALSRLGVTAACVDDIRVALSEACSNVVQHSEADDEYEVRLQVSGNRCEMRVIDMGRGFDMQSLEGAGPDIDAEHGRGIHLMRSLVDAIDFESQPEAGTIVHLVKALELDPDGPLARLAP